MTNNAAIVISVSKYDHERSLPACDNDFDLVSQIIRGANKFDQILELHGYLHSASAKTELAQKIKEWSSTDIGEVFFYYSGHGILHEGEFLFPFSNYHSSNRCTTSLSNTELDDLLRSLSPSTTVKMVDACHAAIEYIKGSSDIDNAMNMSKPYFERLYFFYSSRRSQQSFVDQKYSYFTQSFAKSLPGYKGCELRYHDIISHIRDDHFRVNQQPFYVTQASATEVFCHVTAELAATVEMKLSTCNPDNSEDTSASSTKKDLPCDDAMAEDGTEEESPLLIKIRAVSNECRTSEQAMEILDCVRSTVERYRFGPTIEQCYSRNVLTSESIPRLSSLKKVAKWLQDFGSDFFVDIAHDEEEYEVFEKVEYVEEPSEFAKKLLGTSGLFSPIKKKVKSEPVRKVRSIASGYSLPSGYPFTCLHIVLDSLYAALPGQDIYILPVLSARKIRLFYKQESRRRVDFDSDIASDLNDWASAESLLVPSSLAGDLARNAMRDLDQSILRAVEQSVDL